MVRSPAKLAFVLSVLCLSCGSPQRAGAQPKAPASASSDAPLFAADPKDEAELAQAIREHYTKYEFRIPMRDGVLLFTHAYVPKDRARSYPFLMMRTPYGVHPYGVDNYPSKSEPRTLKRFAPSVQAVRDGFIFVHQDVRGRMMSEGTFVDVRPHLTQRGPKDTDESTDAYDTIDWLVKNVPGNNGKLGVWGVSYPGFYAAQAAIDAHPALKAVSPQAPVTDWFNGDDFHHNGAFFLADAFDFYASFGKPRPKPTPKMVWGFEHGTGDLYEFFLRMGPLSNADQHFEGKIAFWNDLMEHGTLDAFWKMRDPKPHYRNIAPAVLTVGGWFDSEDLYGALHTYKSIETQGARGTNALVMGPWSHGGWARSDGDRLGDVTFGAKTSFYYREQVELPFFRKHLKGAQVADVAEATVFETGTNVWQRYASWPPAGATKTGLFFRSQGRLGTSSPSGQGDDTGADSYPSDPDKPVPYIGKNTPDIVHEYMTADQRFAARRPDVLVFQTPVLGSDVTLGGPIQADLWVSTTGTDADFVVKLIDVYPDNAQDPEPNPQGVRMAGYQQLVRGEVMRGKFRNSFSQPEPFKPGERARVQFSIPDVLHTFRTGHRIMVQVQSTWFPLVDRNPQTFTDIYRAKPQDFIKATHQVHRSKEAPSGISVHVLRGKLPE
jgi:putative CocE/NonD family hydrolase